MGLKITNNAFATLASSISDSVTSITVASGQGARFPTLGAGDYFYATLVDISNNFEIVKCTDRVNDVLTVVRGQDGSSARAYAVGDRLEIRPVAAIFDGKQNYIPVGTVGQVIVSNGTDWVAGAAPGFPSGTRMSFQQSTAPTGWTKDTNAAINDAILRLVTGSVSSGGSVGWSAATVGATTLSTNEIPSHRHSILSSQAVTMYGTSRNQPAHVGTANGDYTDYTQYTGGGGSHTHGLAGTCKYYDFIIASKD